MPGIFADFNKQLKTVKRNEERELVTDRVYEELDRLRDLVDNMLAGNNPGGAANKPPGSFTPSTTVITNPSSPTVTREDSEQTTFEVPIASGQTIMQDQFVSMGLAASGIVVAYLADASNTERRADAIVVGTVYRGGEKRLICSRRLQTRVRMASGAMPTVGAELFLSALTPGALTDNPSESSTRKFSQRVATYLYQAKNALGELQAGVAWADVQLSPASSLPAAASA